MAGGATSRGRSGAIVGINVTPLVDITLVLLIIFMVTAKLIVNRQAMSVDLPRAASGKDVQEVLSVVLAASGQTEVNGEAVPGDEAIGALARTAFAKDKDVRAVLKADATVQHARVMHALDLLRLAGIAKVGFGVVPPKPTRDPH